MLVTPVHDELRPTESIQSAETLIPHATGKVEVNAGRETRTGRTSDEQQSSVRSLEAQLDSVAKHISAQDRTGRLSGERFGQVQQLLQRIEHVLCEPTTTALEEP